ncbi:Putative endo-1,3(4)-beta-glucanase [Tolypocladium paradoxum]|uniref:Endo-1,3(4)-beta-glucanase n=1 Tax=Tolypocladium paradoxum TaxID=94208 RepID=A0A2S4L5A4_9HYPO|nr:Putative endo-1,3(4)-beta-glucanase [Tolypocladium paradoxum]
MAPSLPSLCTAALACASSVVATKWQLSETYDVSNFFDKFDFFTAPSPNAGLVNFQSRADALQKGLIAYQGNEVYMGVDHKTVITGNNRKRDSVRIESKARYNHGLFIARFTHLPENKCGLWPAFWMYGENWPNDGEVDIMEWWNNAQWNQPALHVGASATYGQCLMDGAGQSANVVTSNCDNGYSNPPNQWMNQGCVAADHSGPWATLDGGVFAMEWTSDFIKLYSWHWSNVPSNIGDDAPDSASWGTPMVYLKNKQCDIDNHFSNQKLVLNLDMCGNPVGSPDIWWTSCAAVTKQATCEDYISNFPDDFSGAYFKLKDIRYFNAVKPATTTTSSTLTSTTSTTASSTSTSTTSTTASSISTSTTSTTALSTSTSTTLTTALSMSTSTTSTTASSTSTTTSSTSTSTTSTTASSTSTSTILSKTTMTISSTKITTTSTSLSSKTTSSGTSSNATSSTSVTSSKPGENVETTKTTQTQATTASITISSTLMHSSKWANSSSTAAPTATSSVDLTTSTVYTTTVHTVTKCPPWVIHCPAGGYTTTETIALYTTVCPVTATQKPTKPTTTTTSSRGAGGRETTITTKVTRTYTITSCAPTVTNCPVGKVTSEVRTTTYCPGEQTPGVPYVSVPGKASSASSSAPAKTASSVFTAPSPLHPSQTTLIYQSQAAVPQPAGPSGNGSNNAIAKPSSATPAPCVGPSCPVSGNPSVSGKPGGEPCRGDNCPPKMVVSGAAKTSFSSLVVLCVAAALML